MQVLDKDIPVEVVNSDLIDNPFTIRKKKLMTFSVFWAGFMLYTINSLLALTGHISFAVGESFQAVALILMVTAGIKIIDFKIDSSFIKLIYIALCLWTMMTILRGTELLLDINFLKSFLFSAKYGGLLYFIPLLMLFPKHLAFYKNLFDAIIIVGILYLVFDLFFIKNLIGSGDDNVKTELVEHLSELSFPCAFILLTYKYHSKKRILFAAAVLVISVLFAIIRARRGIILMISTVVLFSYLLYLFTSKQKMLTIYLSILVISIGGLYTNHLYKPEQSNLFGYLLERGDEDTRTGVEEYFYADFKPKDWIIGRGIDGQYFAPDISEDQITNYRDVIETGYLQIVLKGGLISLGLIVLLGFFAIIKGFFCSNNILPKAAALWILWAILSMYPATINTFTLRYFIFWISMGICFSKEIRTMPESAMVEYFHSFFRK